MTPHTHKHYGADAVVRGAAPKPSSDMNITPMIDVLLVLLVIFMAVRAIYEGRRDKTMFIIGDGTLRYGEIVGVLDAARGAGVARVGIVTERMRKGLS